MIQLWPENKVASLTRIAPESFESSARSAINRMPSSAPTCGLATAVGLSETAVGGKSATPLGAGRGVSALGTVATLRVIGGGGVEGGASEALVPRFDAKVERGDDAVGEALVEDETRGGEVAAVVEVETGLALSILETLGVNDGALSRGALASSSSSKATWGASAGARSSRISPVSM